MSTSVARQINARMKAKNLSIGILEKEAGLKIHAVRNILRGKSKRPSGQALQAIADVFGCTVRDLLTEDQEIFEGSDSVDSNEALLNSSYKYPMLLAETIKVVNDKIEEKNQELTIQQVLTSIQEIYLHSLQKDPEKVDQNFADWFIDLTEE
jgi:transcriptional regulator with XRE-family HTH domain